MPAVSAAELQTISDWMSANVLTDTCAIQREVNSVWTTVTGMGAVPCLLSQPESYEKDISNEQTGAVMKKLLLPRGTDVRSPDRLVIGGINYRVFALREPETYEILRRVLIVRFPQRGGAL